MLSKETIAALMNLHRLNDEYLCGTSKKLRDARPGREKDLARGWYEDAIRNWSFA